MSRFTDRLYTHIASARNISVQAAKALFNPQPRAIVSGVLIPAPSTVTAAPKAASLPTAPVSAAAAPMEKQSATLSGGFFSADFDVRSEAIAEWNKSPLAKSEGVWIVEFKQKFGGDPKSKKIAVNSLCEELFYAVEKAAGPEAKNWGAEKIFFFNSYCIVARNVCLHLPGSNDEAELVAKLPANARQFLGVDFKAHSPVARVALLKLLLAVEKAAPAEKAAASLSPKAPAATLQAHTPSAAKISRVSDPKEISYAAYSAMEPAARAAFFKAGGKLANLPDLQAEHRAAYEAGRPKPKAIDKLSYKDFSALSPKEKSKFCLNGGQLLDAPESETWKALKSSNQKL